jgi:hypothetical protein
MANHLKSFRSFCVRSEPLRFLVLLLLTSCGPASESASNLSDPALSPGEEVAPASDPDHPYGELPASSDIGGEKNFAKLLNQFREARPRRAPWVGYWWPYTTNGVANGRYAGGSSPAGKYDAARGNRTQAQTWEVLNHGARVPGVQGWWGHCNGWCVAAALFPEPIEAQKVNGIRFDVADQKALLSEAAMEVSADFFGNRVDWASDWNSPKYDDVIPAQYFLVLTNYMGKLAQTVLIDRYTGDQVWNQPLAGYRFQYPTPADYLGEDPGAPGVYRVLVTSTIWWARDDVDPNAVSLPFEFEANVHFEERTLKMELWLDAPVQFDSSGRMISSGDVVVVREGNALLGGLWRNGSGLLVDAHPDYMWVPVSILKPDPRAEEPYTNIHIDVDWLTRHMSAGQDDPSAPPSPIAPAPVPLPSVSPSPWPRPRPTVTPTPFPSAIPTVTPSVTPSSAPTVIPTVTPSSAPTAVPTVTPSNAPPIGLPSLSPLGGSFSS